jgi:undecaprenyl-diphosphatase
MAAGSQSRRPHSLSPRGLAIAGWSAFLVAGCLFLAIAWNVTAMQGLVALDARVADWLHAHGRPGLIAFLLTVTHLNSLAAIGAWSAVFAAFLARMREWYWMLTLALAVGGAMLLNLALKGAYERLRPRFDEPLVELATYSFPSGHTAAAVAFYGVAAAFLVSRFHEPRRRAACVAGAIAAVALVAFSRLYLGAHYLSDVVAAICSSTAWLVLCLAFGHALARKRLNATWIAVCAAALAALIAAALLPLEDWSDRLGEAVGGMSLAGGLVIFCAASALGALLLVPAWVFTIAAGAVFGFGWGLLAALVSAAASALAAFLLARYVLRRHVERLARRQPAFKAMDAAVATEGWKIVALLRMSPVMPSGLKSYFLGLTRVALGDYFSASLVGMFPGIALKVYIGAAGRGALTEGGPLDWAMLAAGIAATLTLALLFGRYARKRLSL